MSTHVTSLDRGSKGRYTLTVNGTQREYDIVIIASPVDRLGFASPLLPQAEVYQQTHVTFVEGTPSHDYFGQAHIPDLVLTVEQPHVEFLSMGRMPTREHQYFKLFTRAPVEPDLLGRMFSTYNSTSIVRRVFHAYPQYSSACRFPRFSLAPGLFHTNAIESLASAIEMSLIAGRNVALLAAQHLGARAGSPGGGRPHQDEL